MVYYFGLIGYAHLWGIVRKKCELDLVMAKRVMLDKKRKCVAEKAGDDKKAFADAKAFQVLAC
ncbi:TPA: hypothetical protein RUZ56_001322 [Vibrio cholerae]|uniref:hypothetical protein n=1 Tax=Vibrio cholerae TaxID=666 RepID=UPI00019F6642|nr:hypothetical protein [Vibrio cholerae]EEO04242.1 hypothetical protein VCA_003280 [Vibrio cholerae VL426]MCD6675682.1 hypothetical protein [Vibrio cholerae]PNM50181.1 hypothetical protein AL535_012000 [Vibrio cholerae]TQO83839.1 hypothetical protein FLM10_11195 [Vibrio cholerae]TQP45983.1 hypothetical protein FLL90_14695 [Vibrio cholerae]